MATGRDLIPDGGRPSFRGELKAMGRELLKDVRATLHETYFGAPERAGEPGAPLNPTSVMVTREMDGREPVRREPEMEMG